MVTQGVLEALVEAKLAYMLLIDAKSALNKVSRNVLLRKINDIDTDGNLVQRTDFFMSKQIFTQMVDGD